MATENERRALYAKQALTTYVAFTRHRPLDDLSFDEKQATLTDLLGDLHHYADSVLSRLGTTLSMDIAYRWGRDHYDAEHGEDEQLPCHAQCPLDGRCSRAVGLSE